MGSGEKVSLSWGWDNYSLNLKNGFRDLLIHRNYADVTLLSSDCRTIEAHRVILSTFSPFFEKVLQASSHAHPCLYLKGVNHEDLESVLQFIYGGEVEMSQDRLHKFVEVSQDLQIKGMANVNHYDDNFSSDNNNHVVIDGEAGEIGDMQEIEIDNALDEDNSMEVGKETIELQEFNDGEEKEIGHHASDESLGMENSGEPLIQEIETINEIIESKWTKDKTGGYRCKECDFTHKRRDVMRDHIEEHHVNTGGAECHVCQKICKTREKLRRHMYSHQKRVSMSSLSSHHLL